LVKALATSTVIEVPPLPAFARKPFWDQPWIAPALRAPFFDDLLQGWNPCFLADTNSLNSSAAGIEVKK
jgi:hypothetical protein